MSDFLTTGGVAKASDTCQATIRRYADAGWITCQFDSAGRRLFSPRVVGQVREIKEKRLRECIKAA